MTAIRVVVLCVAGALVCALLRVQKPEFRPAVGIAAALSALFMILPELSEAARVMGLLADYSAMDSEQLMVLLRATGIALLAEAGAQICTDAGENALAGRIYLAARLVLLVMSLPLLGGLIRDLTELTSG